MSKPASERRVAENEAMAYAKYIRVSPRKLNLVAETIRGLSADAAIATLTFNRRRIAQDVKKVLQSAVANAENNHQLDVDRLVVVQASVGKTVSIKRVHARARGRASRVEKLISNLTVVVRERPEAGFDDVVEDETTDTVAEEQA